MIFITLPQPITQPTSALETRAAAVSIVVGEKLVGERVNSYFTHRGKWIVRRDLIPYRILTQELANGYFTLSREKLVG